MPRTDTEEATEKTRFLVEPRRNNDESVGDETGDDGSVWYHTIDQRFYRIRCGFSHNDKSHRFAEFISKWIGVIITILSSSRSNNTQEAKVDTTCCCFRRQETRIKSEESETAEEQQQRQQQQQESKQQQETKQGRP
jgi:hypothetical protein